MTPRRPVVGWPVVPYGALVALSVYVMFWALGGMRLVHEQLPQVASWERTFAMAPLVAVVMCAATNAVFAMASALEHVSFRAAEEYDLGVDP